MSVPSSSWPWQSAKWVLAQDVYSIFGTRPIQSAKNYTAPNHKDIAFS